MIRFVWRTDVHLSDRAPSSRKDNWTDTVFRKLDQVRNVAKKVGAVAILDGGDFFHIKSPGRNSHALVHRAIDHHTAYPCPVYCTPGNHDSIYGDYAFLPQQPLGVLFASGAFRRLYDEHEAIFEQDGVKVRVVGIPYHGTSYDMDRFHSIKKGDEDYLVCVAHVLASTKGGTMFEGEDIVKYKDLLDTAPDVYFFGHWHKDQGVVSMGDKTFVNIGSLTRGALSQDEMERKPACAFISFTKDEEPLIRVIRLNVEDPHKVFDVEGRVRQEKQQVEMDAFVTRIRESLQEGSEAVSLSSLVTGMEDIPAQVRERALAYLEQA